MKFAEEHPEELSKVARIQAQVQEVKGVMKDNIQQVSSSERRGISLDVLLTGSGLFPWLGTSKGRKAGDAD